LASGYRGASKFFRGMEIKSTLHNDIQVKNSLTDVEDQRCSPFSSADSSLSTLLLYKMIMSSRSPSHPSAAGHWSSRAPLHVQILHFASLASTTTKNNLPQPCLNTFDVGRNFNASVNGRY